MHNNNIDDDDMIRFVSIFTVVGTRPAGGCLAAWWWLPPFENSPPRPLGSRTKAAQTIPADIVFSIMPFPGMETLRN